jgi:hypothetical protein
MKREKEKNKTKDVIPLARAKKSIINMILNIIIFLYQRALKEHNFPQFSSLCFCAKKEYMCVSAERHKNGNCVMYSYAKRERERNENGKISSQMWRIRWKNGKCMYEKWWRRWLERMNGIKFCCIL